MSACSSSLIPLTQYGFCHILAPPQKDEASMQEDSQWALPLK
jgi:hypothetical protein